MGEFLDTDIPDGTIVGAYLALWAVVFLAYVAYTSWRARRRRRGRK